MKLKFYLIICLLVLTGNSLFAQIYFKDSYETQDGSIPGNLTLTKGALTAGRYGFSFRGGTSYRVKFGSTTHPSNWVIESTGDGVTWYPGFYNPATSAPYPPSITYNGQVKGGWICDTGNNDYYGTNPDVLTEFSGDVDNGVINAAPIGVADTYFATAGVTLTVADPGLLSNDTDAEGNPLTVVLNTAPSHGSVSMSGTGGFHGGFTYTPATGYVGSDSFTYKPYDGNSYGVPVTVTITVRSTDAGLSNLALSVGTIFFSSTTYNYTPVVAATNTSIVLTPTLNDAAATVKVAGVLVGSGIASAALPLTIGNNPIDVIVTAQDGATTKTYTVKVFRSDYTTPTNPATVVALTNVRQTTATVSWTNGSGTSRAVFIAVATIGSPALVNNTTYTANATFGSGSLAGTGWYCIYNGTGSTVNITGLTENTAYRIKTVEYNGIAGLEKYTQPAGAGNPVNSITLAGKPITNTLAATGIGIIDATLNGNTNSNGAATAVSFTYGTVADLSSGTTTVLATTGAALAAYAGVSASAITLSGLIPATTYYYRVSAENATGVTNNAAILSFKTNPKLPQVITFYALPIKSYGNIDFAVGAISDNSGVPLSYVSDNLNVAIINSGNIQIIGAGIANITVSQIADATHNAAQSILRQLTVNKLPITVTAAAKSKTYGDLDPSLTYANTALVGGDLFTGALVRDPGINIGDYPIKQGSLALSTNYVLTYVGDNLTIGTKAITLTAAAKSKIYGDADPALTYANTALVAGDLFTGALVRDPGINIGDYPIKQGSLALSTNYVLTYVGDNLTIGTKAIRVTAAAKSKIYGDADPALTYTNTALVAGDLFTGALVRDPGINIGDYPIKQGSLALSTNYVLTYVGENLTIGTKAITVTADAKSKIYGAVDPALTYTNTALVGGDLFTGSLVRDPAINVANYLIKQGTLALSANYVLTYVGNNLTLNTKAITVAAAAKSKVYGAVDPALTYTYTALVGGDLFTGSLVRDPGINIGVYPIKQGTLALSANYVLTYVGENLTIGTKAITVTAAAKSKTYGDADPALTYANTALVAGDLFTGSLARDPGINIGVYPIKQGTLALSTNYVLTYVGENLTIGIKAIMVTAAVKSKTYGDLDPSLTYANTALVGGDLFTGSLVRDPGINIGVYAIKQGTLALSTNYVLMYVGENLTIGTKAITVTAAAKSKIYGDADPALTYANTALVAGDLFTGALVRDPGINIGDYPIKQGSLALSTNYVLTYFGDNLTIGTKAITVTAAAKSKIYGDLDPVLTYITTGSIGADAFTGALVRDPGINIGDYPIKQGTLALSTNYVLNYVGENLAIGTKSITVTAAAKSKVYGDVDPLLTYTNSALIGADAFTGALVRDPGINIGNYPIKQGTLALSTNYILNYVGAQLSIGTKVITVTAAAKSKIYGDLDPTLTYTNTGLVGTDVFTGALSREPGEIIGAYLIKQGSLALNSNYIINYAGASLTVDLRILNVTAENKTKTYGSPNPVLTVAYTGFSAGDNSSNINTSPTINTTAMLSSEAGSYPIKVTGLVIPNYNIVYTPAQLTVTKASLTVTAEHKSRAFGIPNPALTVVYSGFVNGDGTAKLIEVPVASSIATISALPGNYPITLAGGVSNNYTFNYVPGILIVGPLTVSTLTSLSLNKGTLTPAFTSAVLSYKVLVENVVSELQLTPVFDPTATVSINGIGASNGIASSRISLNVGNNALTVVVTAQDGVTKTSYNLNVYRGMDFTQISATNILSANGDGKNDLWMIQDIQLYPNNIVSVYDRNGRIVFTKRGYNNDWDGSLRGAPLTKGTYIYTVDLGIGQPVIKGFITVLKSR